MNPKEDPFLRNPELLVKVPQRAYKVESEIQRFLKAGPNVPLEDLGYDIVNQRIMYAEDDNWQRRRDAYDTTSLIYHSYRHLREFQDQQSELGVFVGFDSLQHQITPYTIVCLLRQQMVNWQAWGEQQSNITIYDVQAAMDRRFYMTYRGSKRKDSGYSQQEVADLFHLCELVDQAVQEDKTCDFQPKQWENIGRFDEFMQSISRIPDEAGMAQNHPE